MLTLGTNANYGDEDYSTSHVREIYLSDDARKQGTYVIGTTGTGKTTFLLNLIYQDMRRRGSQGYEGLCVLDPHSDFTTAILRRVPEDRRDDVVLFDPTDVDCPLGLNLFECNRDDARERDLVVSTIIDTLHKLFADSWGPRMEDLLRHSILSLLLHPDPTTLIHLMMVLTNREHRQRLTAEARMRDPILRAYWEDQFPESTWDPKGSRWRKPREQVELVGSSLNKIGRFIANPIIRHIVGQEVSSFNFRQIMDEGKILLVNLSKGDLGPDNASLLGAVLVNQLLIASLSRKRLPPEQRRPFHLYVDEYQTFATKTFPELQSEARKYAIDTVVAHQYRDQLDLENIGSSLNVANLVALRVSGKDAIELSTQFDATPGVPEVMFRPLYTPVREDGQLWAKEVLPGTGQEIYELLPGSYQLYSDVHLEMANLLAQLPNYQAICRVLTAKEKPRTLHQFRLNLAPDPPEEGRADQIEAYIRQRMCELAVHSAASIAAHIAEYTRSGSGEDGSIPAFDIQ